MESAWWESGGGGRHDGHDGVDDGAASCENSADAKGGRVQADDGSADAGDEEISLTLGPIMPRLRRSYQLEYVSSETMERTDVGNLRRRRREDCSSQHHVAGGCLRG